MHYESTPPPPFNTYGGGYPSYFPTQQPTPPGMPPPRPYYPGHGIHGVPTPSPSPRTPASHSRRQSHDPTAEYPASAARRPASGYHDYPSYVPGGPHTGFSTPPARPHTRASAHPGHPLHTPSPSPSTYYGGYPPSNNFSPGAGPDAGYYSPFGGPTSPPPRARTSQSQRHNSSRGPGQWPTEPIQTGPMPVRSKPLKSKTPIDPAYLKEQAKKNGIPSDYSLKNWDPRERPLILLGSVFDANSLGEWIFNWTKFVHGRNHQATKIAASLWDMLIDFAARLKRANDFSGAIKNKESKETVEDFVETADDIWARLKQLLRACEDYMWRAVKSKAGEAGGAQMGIPSGTEFVDALFNAEKEWERTHKLMNGMDTWCSRFQINCEHILRQPDA